MSSVSVLDFLLFTDLLGTNSSASSLMLSPVLSSRGLPEVHGGDHEELDGSKARTVFKMLQSMNCLYGTLIYFLFTPTAFDKMIHLPACDAFLLFFDVWKCASTEIHSLLMPVELFCLPNETLFNSSSVIFSRLSCSMSTLFACLSNISCALA